MSLATTGAGAGMGGGGPGAMAMAHQANQMGQGLPPPPNAGDYADTGHGASVPSASILGADLMDKQQLSLKYVKNTSSYPIVAIDLFRSDPLVACFPKKNENPSMPVFPILIGKMKSKIVLKKSDQSHKIFRKYLNYSKSYVQVKADCLGKLDDKEENVVVLDEPYRWLGVRRFSEVPHFLANSVSSNLINGSLEGPEAVGNDNDRVLYRISLNSTKKPLTLLPEEATLLLVRQAQYHVHNKIRDDATDVNDEDIIQYPTAIAIPAWAAHDSAVEAILDTVGSGGVFFQRSVCALVGALQQHTSKNILLHHLDMIQDQMAKDYRRLSARNPELDYENELTIVLLGVAGDGLEATAVKLSDVQPDLTTCIFGNLKVISNVSYMTPDPCSLVETCICELKSCLETVAPGADGPCAIVTYGNPSDQDKISKSWKGVSAAAVQEWKNISVLSTMSDCVAIGTAVLGAVTHGRQLVLVPKSNDSSKLRAELGIRVQNVATAAVGYRVSYHGENDETWTAVKEIFEFDRRIPAGPYPLDFHASECAVHRGNNTALSDDEFTKATKEMEGSKFISVREDAALALRVDIVQRWTRDGDWIKVGETIEPLVKLDEESDEAADDESVKIACESVTLEISLGVNGLLTTSLIGERESVVQAVKSARTSAFRFYAWIVAAIVFFGGFLAKSYWEEYVLNRDTQKLLVYYKHVLPGSISDGDEHNARWIVYKYRHNKKTLWQKMELKYGEPLREVNEWDNYNKDAVELLVEEKEVDLDENVDEFIPNDNADQNINTGSEL